MNANRMRSDPREFGRDILRHYDPCCLWRDSEAECRFWDKMARERLVLYQGAANGWGMQESFFERLADLVIHKLLPNLNDSEQGFTFHAVLEICERAGLDRYYDAPPREHLELRFYKIAAAGSVPKLAAFFNDNWACALIAAGSEVH